MKIGFLLSGMLCLLAGCTGRGPANGWYFITDGETNAYDPYPIVTAADFGALRIDSVPEADGSMTYVIAGRVKAGRVADWADATERATGRQIGFLYRGRMLVAPYVNARIENGNFAIASPELIRDREKTLDVYENLTEEMR